VVVCGVTGVVGAVSVVVAALLAGGELDPF